MTRFRPPVLLGGTAFLLFASILHSHVKVKCFFESITYSYLNPLLYK